MTSRTPPVLPLVAYAESLCDKARVLVVGDASSEVARALLDRGARLVHVCDRNAARRSEAQARTSERSISFGGLEDGPATLRDSFFDLCLFENLALEPSPGAALATVKRLLAPRGVLLVSTPNHENQQPLLRSERGTTTLDYYSLYDNVIAHFPAVRMLGQVPFAGYAIVDFSAEGEPTPVLDTSLVPPRGEEPDYYVAFAGRERRLLEQYVVVELPLATIRAEAARSEPEVRAAKVELKAAKPEVAAAKSEVASAKPEAVRVVADPNLTRKLAQQETWIAELESRATTADERADIADERAEAAERRAEAAEQRAGEAEQRLADDTRRVETAEKRAGEAEQRLAGDTRRAGEAEQRLEADSRRVEAAERRADTAEQRADAGARRVEVAERALLELKLKLETLDRAWNEERAGLVREQGVPRAELERRVEQVSQLERQLAEKTTALAGFAVDDESARELSALEALLRERGEHVTQLEGQLAECERVGRELVRKLRGAQAGEAAQALAERLALAEADIVSLRWSLSLSRTGAGRNPGSPS